MFSELKKSTLWFNEDTHPYNIALHYHIMMYYEIKSEATELQVSNYIVMGSLMLLVDCEEENGQIQYIDK